jgi:hypothetical protein
MTGEMCQDLDAILEMLLRPKHPFPSLGKDHEGCMEFEEIMRRAMPLVALRNQSRSYVAQLLGKLKEDDFLASSGLDHLKLGLQSFHLDIAGDGYVARARGAEEDRRRAETMRESEYQANLAAVASAEQANLRARSANRAAWFAGIVALATMVYGILSDSRRSDPEVISKRVAESTGPSRVQPSSPSESSDLGNGEARIDSLAVKAIVSDVVDSTARVKGLTPSGGK